MSTGWTRVGSSLETSGHESEHGSGVESNMSTNLQEQERGRLQECPVALALSDDLAFLLRVVHTMVVPRGYQGAQTSGAETNLVKPFGSVASGYPHPPMIPAIQMVLESVPGYFLWYLLPFCSDMTCLATEKAEQVQMAGVCNLDYIFEEALKVI
ncbi:hypothetical protein EDD16DRAFT_1728140 [Pisolithus croceorrhizus]|nr:hypothetical protein EDD16DRAFT_1728140 [Pisolithus croceorrhizus]